MEFSVREKNLLFIIAMLAVWAIVTTGIAWDAGDDYHNGFREGTCAAQNAEFVSPNLCMNGDKVVSVWK